MKPIINDKISSLLKKLSYIFLGAISSMRFHSLADDLNHPLFGTRATSATLRKPSRAIPPSLEDGRIPTLNQTGYMTSELDEFSDDFINSAAAWAEKKLPVVDIGAAYGITAIPALANNGIVIANDIGEEHLLHLRVKAGQELWPHLYLNNKRFPEDLTFPNNSIGAIIMRSVAPYFKPTQMEVALDNANKWLTPGGELYIITISPYHYSLGSFIKTYDEHWDTGNSWPGEILNLKKYIPDLAKDIPNYLHVMDERPLKKALETRGFEIVTSKLFGFARSHSKDPKGIGYYGIKAIKHIMK